MTMTEDGDNPSKSDDQTVVTQQDDSSFGTRIDEDPGAESGDTRIRVESGEHDTYELRREKYELVQFETADMDEDGDGFERYDWHPEETFVLHGDGEAEQFAQMLSEADAFDPNVLFFRQREWSDE